MPKEDERYYDEEWFYDEAFRACVLRKAGYYDIGKSLEKEDYEVVMPVRKIAGLVECARKQGFLAIAPDSPDSREEDLKILHRLLDIIQQVHPCQNTKTSAR